MFGHLHDACLTLETQEEGDPILSFVAEILVVPSEDWIHPCAVLGLSALRQVVTVFGRSHASLWPCPELFTQA